MHYLDTFFITVTDWMVSDSLFAYLGCLLWGVVSVVFSPCHLASIPLVVSYVSGQNRVVRSWQATCLAVLFTLGLFITIAVIGLACALLGRMLGDIGPYWTIPVGLVLVWISLDMLGIKGMSFSSGLLARFKLRGGVGAFVLGLCYGVLSGSCTFGFLAPMLAVITIQEKVVTGSVMILMFGIGHCLPIAVAGSSAAAVQNVVNNQNWSRASRVIRKMAGVVVITLGLYFVAKPFMA